MEDIFILLAECNITGIHAVLAKYRAKVPIRNVEGSSIVSTEL